MCAASGSERPEARSEGSDLTGLKGSGPGFSPITSDPSAEEVPGKSSRVVASAAEWTPPPQLLQSALSVLCSKELRYI